jgi:hypothetical protein
MFVEGKEEKDKLALWFEERARRHPGMFTAALVLLATGVTVGLLLKTDYAIVLYQGF